MSRWFRHYAGMVRDDKLVRAALRAGQSIERVVWVYGSMLESAAEINDGGRFDFDAAEAAYFLRADVAELQSIEASLADCGRIHEGRVVKWGYRQFKSDDSAERVRRHRERQKDTAKGVETGGRESTNPESNGPVTLHNAPETETETETEKKDAANAAPKLSVVPPADPEFQLFERGKQVLGSNAGGMIKNLLKAKGRIELARAVIETAATKHNPREYVAGAIKGSEEAGDGYKIVNGRRVYSW